MRPGVGPSLELHTEPQCEEVHKCSKCEAEILPELHVERLCHLCTVFRDADKNKEES